MSTLIRPELSETNRYWIEKHRYYELKHFCLQYPLWRHAYNSLIDYPGSWPQLVPPCKTNVVSDPVTKHIDDMPNEPYVISPDDYGENDNYTQISLVYYAGDGVLADDEDEVVEDIEDTVGEDFAEHFGEYEDDSVFIRNDRLRCDYEILRDNRSFSDVAEGSNY